MSHAPTRRVLLVQTQAENAGAQEVARLLARGLDKRGHTVRQVFYYRKTESFRSFGELRFCSTERPAGPVALAIMLWKLNREIRSFRPDVVLCFQHYGNLIGGVLARLAGVPVVVANHNSASDVVHPVVQVLDRFLGSVGLYDRIVAVSNAAAAEYKTYPDRYRRRMTTIPHGVDAKVCTTPKSELRRRYGLPAAAPVIGCAARLHPSKNLESLVRLLKSDENLHVALAGQGPDRARLSQFAESLACTDRLHFLGELNAEEMSDFFGMLDVFAFPSLAETFGIAAVEAAQAGLPVVANALPILMDVLKTEAGEACAIFADARDDQALAQAVASVLDDTSLARQLGERGRLLAQRYSVDEMVVSYERLFGGSGVS